MKYWIILFFALLSLSSCSGQFNKILKDISKSAGGELTAEEIVGGLKEALSNGAAKGSDMLSQKDGYYKSIYKILLPPEAKSVCDKLSIVPGFEKIEEDVTEKLNRAAEDAAAKAKPIFLQAIRSMNIQDAWNILTGEDNAATQYLHRTTHMALYDEFKPVIDASLQKVGALQLWSSAVTQYNKIPLVKKANPDMSDYVTQKALSGLFSKIAEEEKEIRYNLSARTSDLLRKVFAKQDKGK